MLFSQQEIGTVTLPDPEEVHRRSQPDPETGLLPHQTPEALLAAFRKELETAIGEWGKQHFAGEVERYEKIVAAKARRGNLEAFK